MDMIWVGKWGSGKRRSVLYTSKDAAAVTPRIVINSDEKDVLEMK